MVKRSYKEIVDCGDARQRIPGSRDGTVIKLSSNLYRLVQDMKIKLVFSNKVTKWLLRLKSVQT